MNSQYFYTICVMLFLYSTTQTLAAPKNCILNPYYHPVCGSDYRTYGNKDLLACYNRQRAKSRHVRIIYHRECEALICPSFADLHGPWPEMAPVCANNGYTYGHIHQVRCLKDLMPGLAILHEGGCTLYEVRKALGRNAYRKACAEPRKSYEKNAICTTRNETYSNPFKALCIHPQALREKVGGVCGCPFQRSCEKAREIQRIIRQAPVNERLEFVVCGSDWRTYRSKHHLECARRYNGYLYMKHIGRCAKFEDPCPENLKFIKTSTPVCGSDNRSYISYDALLCAQFRIDKGLKFLHSGACVKKT